jgi:hypothetical protein
MSSKTLAAVLVLLVGGSTVSADRWRDRRREDRREERREERRERREERREERAYRRHAPPAVRVERWAPRRGFVWVNGYWDWQGDNYVWVGGHYERERRGQRWRDRRWEDRNGEWVSVDGGWVSIGPSSAPPAVRVERYDTRSGFIWVRGYWDWRGDQWAWVPGHYERERAGYVYREPRWEQRDGAWISVQGSWTVR